MKSDVIALGAALTIQTKQKDEQKQAARPMTAIELGSQNKKL